MSTTRSIGPQDHCVQCGEMKETILRARRRNEDIFCAIVDYWGETQAEWDRHKFTWTQKDADSLTAEDAYWESVADMFARDEATA